MPPNFKILTAIFLLMRIYANFEDCYTVNFMAAVNTNVGLRSKKVSGASASHPNDFSVSLVTLLWASVAIKLSESLVKYPACMDIMMPSCTDNHLVFLYGILVYKMTKGPCQM